MTKYLRNDKNVSFDNAYVVKEQKVNYFKKHGLVE